MSKLKVTFDSDANAKAFADKWKLSTPEGDSLDLEWHLAEDEIKIPLAPLSRKMKMNMNSSLKAIKPLLMHLTDQV